jgi:hypothetical protein
MTAAEAAVRSTLAPGGLLSAARIRREAALADWSARSTLAQLQARDPVVASQYRGRSALATKARAAQ